MLEFFFILCAFINCKAQFDLFARSSLRLYTYRNYGSTTVSNYKMTPDVSYVSFRFVSHDFDDCDREIIHVYIRFGSLPIIDPKNVSFPSGFVISNQKLYSIRKFSTEFNYSINIASPLIGNYFVVAFLHPKHIESSIVWNFAPKTCKIKLTTSVYVQRGRTPSRIQFHKLYQVFLNPNKTKPVRFQFYKTKEVGHAELSLRNINFHGNSSSFVVKLTQGGISHSSLIVFEIEVTKDNSEKEIVLNTLQWGIAYCISFFAKELETVDFFFEINNSNPGQNSSVMTTQKYYTYKVRKFNPFTFFFYLVHSNSNVINLNSNQVSTVLFLINDEFDTGGTLSFRVSAKLSEDQEVIVCFNNTLEIPMKSNLCVGVKHKSRSRMVLSSDVKEVVIHVPYPLPGTWYASFIPVCIDTSRCSSDCHDLYNACTKNCTEKKCANQIACDLCKDTCDFKTRRFKCKSCNKFDEYMECPESNVTFTLASHSCFEGRCANGGICVQKISMGSVYSVCTCYNKFIGWTCSNGRNIVSPQMIRLEIFLLLSSLLIFLVAGYYAWKRKCYEESTVFVIKFFSSCLNHSCQSGKYLYNLCIFDGGKLFAMDAYCGILTVWLIVGAVACLRKPLRNVFNMIGAVLVAYCVIINYPEWIYVAVISLHILVGIFHFSYQKFKLHIRFQSSLYTYVYLPFGIVMFCTAMLIYVLIQTESNFMYCHSVWHVLLGLSYIFLVPDEKYTVPAIQSRSSSDARRYIQSQLSNVGTGIVH